MFTSMVGSDSPIQVQFEKVPIYLLCILIYIAQYFGEESIKILKIIEKEQDLE